MILQSCYHSTYLFREVLQLTERFVSAPAMATPSIGYRHSPKSSFALSAAELLISDLLCLRILYTSLESHRACRCTNNTAILRR